MPTALALLLRRIVVGFTLLSFLTTQTAAVAGLHEEGTAAGQAANPVVRETITAPGASSARHCWRHRPWGSYWYGTTRA